MVELKPCPFCGGKAIFKTYATMNHSFYGPGYEFHIKCSKCGTSFPRDNYIITMYMDEDGNAGYRVDGREEAAQEWNRRYDMKGE